MPIRINFLFNALRTLGSLLVVGSMLFFYTIHAHAAQVKLAWNASPSATVAGYNVYYGTTSGSYPNKQNAGPATTYTTPDLSNGTYYFVVKAYDGAGNESGPSNEVSANTSSPVANISAKTTTGTAPLTVNFTGTSTGGTATTWSWNFGDNTTSTEQNPSKTYSSAGTYTVTLTASGPGGSNTVTKTNYITVTDPATAPVASFTANPTSGPEPLMVTLVDTSTGSISSRSWNFGDGTTTTVSTAQTFVKSYAYKNTPYTVTLTVTSAGGSNNTKTQPITANAVQPAANFSATTTSVPLTVKVSNSSTGTVTGWSWNFGDGGTSTVQNPPDYTYKAAGTYTISLTATGPTGTTPSTKTQTITVTAVPPGSELVAAYNFEEASGNTVVDASGKGNHGTISGATRTSSGKFGNALSFNGVNNWVTVNDSASLDLTTGMTLEAWVYPTAITGYQTVIMKELDAIYYLYANTTYNGVNAPAMGLNIGGYKEIYGQVLSPNSWVHLAATYDGTMQSLYVNGRLVAQRSLSGAIQNTSSPLRIGGNSKWVEYFKGTIDEIRIYKRALSVNEIQSDMNKSVTASSPPKLLLGNQVIGSVSESLSQGMAAAYQTTASVTGLITSLPVYVDTGSASTKLVVGLYANNNGHPGALLAQGTLNSPKAGSWNSVSLPATKVNAGTTYWVTILSPSGMLKFRDKVGSTAQPSETSSATTLTTLPSTWTTGTISGNGPLSGYGAGY